MAWREFAPAPVEIANGKTPNVKANDVITIGRKRSLAASIAASAAEKPSSVFITANSTIKIAVLAAKPMSVTNPT